MRNHSPARQATERHGVRDPVSLGILWSRLIAIVDEAGATLMRTPFSTIVCKVHDFASMLTDTRGSSVTNSPVTIPVFLGSMSRTMPHCLERYPPQDWKPGDIAITNDPWLDTAHLRDVTIVRLIFHQAGWWLSLSLQPITPDIGGTIWLTDAREVYEEGLRNSINKLLSAGKPNQQLLGKFSLRGKSRHEGGRHGAARLLVPS